jgi:alkanesulfonate monooxygenase SsuD/methylene tetrahydromethanopterin reductase-like flavin-dependent oxidoreductase (luciferase family)
VDIGIGLPSTIPGLDRSRFLEWSRRADDAGFSTLGTIDRVVFGNYETIPTLAAAAAVTERIRLTTSILIGPFRGNGTLLAKQLATIDRLSAGRLVVGIAVGGREDDFTATGSDFEGRGVAQDALLAEMRAVWDGEARGMAGAVGPPPVQDGGPPLLIGGTGAAAIRRTVRYGAGWIAGGGGAAMFAGPAQKAREAWTAAGRDGSPRLVALGYYSLGPDAVAASRQYLLDYYGFLGETAEYIAAGTLTSPEQVRSEIDAYDAAGCDELILFPCSPDPVQVDLLAAVTVAA